MTKLQIMPEGEESQPNFVCGLAPRSVVVEVGGSRGAVEALRQTGVLDQLLRSGVQVVVLWKEPHIHSTHARCRAHRRRNSIEADARIGQRRVPEPSRVLDSRRQTRT